MALRALYLRSRGPRPDQDAPQVRKTETAKAGSTQDFGEGVIFEIDRGEGRKSFPSRLDRRQLIEFELVSSGWLKSEPIGTGTWGGAGRNASGGLDQLRTQSEVEGEIAIKDGDKNQINTIKVVARLSEPIEGGGSGSGGSITESDGIAVIVDDVVASKQAAIGARFSGQPTEAMKTVAKVCMRPQALMSCMRGCSSLHRPRYSNRM